MAHQFWFIYPPAARAAQNRASSNAHAHDVHVDEEELREMCRERAERTGTPESTALLQQQQQNQGTHQCPFYDQQQPSTSTGSTGQYHRPQQQQGVTCHHPHHQRRSAEKRDSFRSAPPSRQQSFHSAFRQGTSALEAICRAPIATLDCMEEDLNNQQQQQAGQGPVHQQHTTAIVDAAVGDLEAANANTLTPAVITSVRSSTSLSRQSSSVTPGLKFRNLGKSGLKVSNVGLATWVTFGPHVTEEMAESVVTLAYEAGINVFDTSEVYSCGRAETLLGNILQKKGWNRASYNVITKIHWGKGCDPNLRSLSRKTIIESIKASLKRLQLDYIDVVIIHKADPMCPMEEVVRAISYCINKGWAMYWGTSRWSPVEIFEAYTNARQFNCPNSIVEQTEYHFYCRDKTELYLPEMYNQIGVGCMTWSPLGVGLVGRYDDGKPLFARPSFKKKYSSLGHPEDQSKDHSEGRGGAACSSSAYAMSLQENRLTVEEFQVEKDKQSELLRFAERFGCTLAQLSLAWCLKNDHVQCVLLGAATPEELIEQLCCLQLVPRLTVAVVTELEQILENKPVRPAMISTLHKQR